MLAVLVVIMVLTRRGRMNTSNVPLDKGERIRPLLITLLDPVVSLVIIGPIFWHLTTTNVEHLILAVVGGVIGVGIAWARARVMFVRAVHATKSVILRRSGAEYALLGPVSYTHLDVYKRQVVNYNPPEADSPNFNETALNLQVQDSVDVFPNVKIATQQFNLLSGKSLGCVTEVFNSSAIKAMLTREIGKGAKVGTITASSLPSPAPDKMCIRDRFHCAS